jgi:glycosyltransferase involved in cell wall biosynthesis
MKLTVCAITKDEEHAIRVMLESVKGIADEIVIGDTGSRDNTVAVAKEYTEKVFRIPWENSFAKARNQVMPLCTGDWILSIDCDETIDAESLALIKPYLASLPGSVDLALVKMVMCHDDGTPYQEFLAERLIRGGKGIQWQGDMHNWVDVAVTPDKRAQNPAIRFIHNRAVKSLDSREARSKQRLQMAETIFIGKIKKDPNDRRSMFYLAGTYLDSGRVDEAIEWFEKYLTISDFPEERYQAAYLLAKAYSEKGDIARAKAVLSAHLIDNYRRAEAVNLLGNIALAQGDFKQAESWFKVASLKPLPVDPMFVEPEAHTWGPHFNLFRTYQKMGNAPKAVEHGHLCVDMGGPVGEVVRYEKNHTPYGAERIAVLVDRGQMDFIQPLIDCWKAQGKSVVVRDSCDATLEPNWADVTWCEWAGPECVKLTQQPKTARIIVRVHGYEVHAGLIPQVDWTKVDDVIFVADYLKDEAIKQAPIIAEACNVYVVPGGVEVEKFTIGEGKTGYKIAMACYGNQKKNFPLALQILAKLPEPYELHIATEWQDHRLQMYVEHLIQELGLQSRVFFYPWQRDLNAFYADKDYYLSTSEEESFHYSLAEAISAGLRPVVHCWKSSRDFYEGAWIFRTVDEAVEMIAAQTCAVGFAQGYRQYAVDHLNIEANRKRIGRIISRPSVAVCGEPKRPYAAEYKILHALEELGCRTDHPEPELVIITGPNPRIEPWMAKCFKVLWQEDLCIGESDKARETWERVKPVIDQVDLVIVQHPGWVEPFKLAGAKEVVYLPILGAVEPFRPLDEAKVYDVGFYGVLTPRREEILRKLGERFEVAHFENYDHEEVNRFINQCRVIVNIHAYDEPIIEWRLAEAMAAGAVIVSEPIPDVDLFPIKGTDQVEYALQCVLDDELWTTDAGRKNSDWIRRNLTLKGQLEKLLEVCGF